MSVPTTSTAAKPTNGTKLNKDGSPRKAVERLPRTPEMVAFSAIDNILKRLPADMRPRILKGLVGLYGAS